MKTLTEKQKRVLNAIEKLRRPIIRQPTLREIAAELGCKGQAAHQHVQALKIKGYL